MAGHVKPIPVPVILAAVNGDENMRLRLETKLIHSIVTSFKVLPV